MSNGDEPSMSLDDLAEFFGSMPPQLAERTTDTLRTMSHEEIGHMVEALNTADPNAFIEWMSGQPGEKALAGMMLQSARTMMMVHDAAGLEDIEDATAPLGEPGEAHAQLDIIEREAAGAERRSENSVWFNDGSMIVAVAKPEPGQDLEQ